MAGVPGREGLFTSWHPGNKEKMRKRERKTGEEGQVPNIPFKDTAPVT
jgi:hypothetical protein